MTSNHGRHSKPQQPPRPDQGFQRTPGAPQPQRGPRTQTPDYQAAVNRSAYGAARAAAPKKKSKLPIVIIVLLVVLALVGGAFALLASGVLAGVSSKDTQTVQTQQTAGDPNDGSEDESVAVSPGEGSSPTEEAEGSEDANLAGVQDKIVDEGAIAAATAKPYNLTTKAVKKVKDHGKKVFTFNTRAKSKSEGVDTSSPKLTAKQKKAVKKAIAKVEGSGASCGFMLIDCATGKGVGYNINKRIYGASSFKGPYCVYVAQKYLETGKKSFSSTLPSGKQNEQGFLSVTGQTDIKTLIRTTITNSDNPNFLALCYGLSREGCGKWLKKMGLRSAIAGVAYQSDYPTYSAKEAAMLWTNTRTYLKTDSTYAKSLKKWFGKTNMSPIRNGLKKVDGAKVRNKAGWCYSAIADPSCCDNAWITVDGREYILCIMSTMNCTGKDGSFTKLSKVAKAVFACRGALE